MESSADNYLHKKFKKQLSIEPKTQHNDKENKDSAGVVEQSEEKTSDECGGKITDNQNADNNESVPNQSTNQNSPSVALNANSNFSKSSISVGNCIGNIQSSNSYISYVVLNNQNNEEQFKPVSFDTAFSTTETTNNSSVNMSSILENMYCKQNYVNKEDTSLPIVTNYLIKDEVDVRNEYNKHEEIQPPPDKSSGGGKYVCTYCNLVCSKPSVLQKHIRAHTNERPYPCISCGFSFKTRSNLYKHCRSRTHANRVMGNKAQEGSELEMSKSAANLPVSSQNFMEYNDDKMSSQDLKNKPYKPRFHTAQQFYDCVAKENIDEERQNTKHADSDILSHHINEIISKNNSIVNSNESTLLKKRSSEAIIESVNNNEYLHRFNRNETVCVEQKNPNDEPLNLTNKNRKRSMSEIAEPVVQKSLIKELLLKNLYSDMQCPYCKMIFQTVTELELHKLRSCKGKPSDLKYTRSSSVNVASILTKNKNAFDNIPQLQNTMFPLNSPGPFLGKTRLVESDKSKSFSFDGGNLPLISTNGDRSLSMLSPLPFEREKKAPPVKMFGGEVKIHSAGETKSFRIDNKDDKYESESNFVEYGGKLSENRVVKSSLQSGGTVLTNKTNYNKQDIRTPQDVIRVYENTSVSPSIDMINFSKSKFNFDKPPQEEETISSDVMICRPMFSETASVASPKNVNISSPTYKYTNIMDFSQKAVKLLTPNIKHKFTFNNVSDKPEAIRESPKSRMEIEEGRNLTVPTETLNVVRKQLFLSRNIEVPSTPPATNIYNPMNLLVNGKVVRYVPGMPGPVVAAESPMDGVYGRNNPLTVTRSRELPVMSPLATEKVSTPVEKSESPKLSKPPIQKGYLMPDKPIDRPSKSPKMDTLEVNTGLLTPTPNGLKSPNREMKSPTTTEIKKFARPNSLALKPTTASLKQHHGLTPTIFNQILISPDTPRVAKKYAQHFLHGNYFSYLGLKSSTKPVYCTLNKTQPFYVPHFKKLSMYSEWRQQDTKADRLYVSSYDSRQRSQKYTTAGKTEANLIIHSSYKFIVSELPSTKTEKNEENKSILGGYECNDDYTYIRGRGRGRYVCDQCGIRCKKPSMLKKHIRTHSNDRPYTCSHCNFSFKTKGNLTKHMKSKAHTKNYTASGGSGSSTQQSGTQSSESDTDDSGMDSSDESSTRQQEHEAAYGLLSLSQKTTQTGSTQSDNVTTNMLRSGSPTTPCDVFMTSEEIAYVSKTNYAKNKILDERYSGSFSATKKFSEITTAGAEDSTDDVESISSYLGKSSVVRPLTYPYTSILPNENEVQLRKTPEVSENMLLKSSDSFSNIKTNSEPKCIKQFHVIQKYAVQQKIVYPRQQPVSPKVTQQTSVYPKIIHQKPQSLSPKIPERPKETVQQNHESPYKNQEQIYNKNAGYMQYLPPKIVESPKETIQQNHESAYKIPERISFNKNTNYMQLPTLKVNDVVIQENQVDRKRKFSNVIENSYKTKVQKNDEVMDLSMTTISEKNRHNGLLLDGNLRKSDTEPEKTDNEMYTRLPQICTSSQGPDVNEDSYSEVDEMNYKNHEYSKESLKNNGTVLLLTPMQPEEHVNCVAETQHQSNSNDQSKNMEYDNSAMETLADIATKQVKLEKNTLAKSVATEFLKLATKHENFDGSRDQSNFVPINKEVNELMVKPEGNKSCTICSKSFNKPSQLRLHMNIHYLERPFRCDSCSVSFRTKGHLQKHERSAGHHNKLSSSPAQSSSEPRPFKCSDCNIAFRIHGHLAKHLRSKMHIMKLECLAKIPFGLYAELERSNSLLTEINTSDGDQCLESLQTLAKKIFVNDPNKLHSLINQIHLREDVDADS